MKLLHHHFLNINHKSSLEYLIALLGLIIICVLGPLSINIGLIDFSFQTFCILLLALVLKPIPSFLILLVYLIFGICGLPVFSGYSSGIEHFMSPSAGFLISFPIIAFLYSKLISKYFRSNSIVFISAIASQILLLVIGFSWIAVSYEISQADIKENILSLMPGLLIKSLGITSINYLLINHFIHTGTIK